MCTHDNYISPYLRRRLRTHEEIVREEAERSELTNRPRARAETARDRPVHEVSDDVEPTR